MRDAPRHEFDVVLAESLDRFSRDQEDTAGLFKRLTCVGVRIVTLAEGDITHLHIGFKGTMNALFLKDLAEKTHRGLRGRIEAGKSGGGLCYRYRVVRSLSGSTLVNGDRQIEHAEAAIVMRVFREFVSGVSPKEMAKRLNREGVSGPGGGKWSPSTIHGHHARGTGILNNELYLGRLVWNRLRYVKDPDTGRRVSRPNPRSQWVTVEVPALRMVDDEMWAAVKERQELTRRTMAQPGGAALCQLRRPRYLFSGLTKCGECGAGFIMGSANRLMCFGARDQGTCTNRLTIRRDEVEARVLRAMQDKLLRPDLFEEFCHEFTREMNRLWMERRAELSSAERELVHLETRRKKLVQSIMDGVPGAEVKDEIISIAPRWRAPNRFEGESGGDARCGPTAFARRWERSARFGESRRSLWRRRNCDVEVVRLRSFGASAERPPPASKVGCLGGTQGNAPPAGGVVAGSEWFKSPCTRRKPPGIPERLSWLRGGDLNPRPLGYEPNELPDCSTPRHRRAPRHPTTQRYHAGRGRSNTRTPRPAGTCRPPGRASTSSGWRG